MVVHLPTLELGHVGRSFFTSLSVARRAVRAAGVIDCVVTIKKSGYPFNNKKHVSNFHLKGDGSICDYLGQIKSKTLSQSKGESH